MAAKKKKPNRAELLKQALAADDDAVASRLASGKTLPLWRRQAIEAELGIEKTGEIVRNAGQLIKVLGIARSTFYRLVKTKGAPGRMDNGSYNVDRWRAFAKIHVDVSKATRKVPVDGNIQVEEETDEDGPKEETRESVTVAKLREELDDLRFDKAIKRGLYLLKSEVSEAIARCNEKFLSELRRVFEQSLPADYAQHSGDETMCRELNRRAIETLREHLHGDKW